MILKRLEISNFRAHEKFALDFSPGVVGITGRNGSGKSSLLEGLYFAITGGSATGETQASQLRWGAKSGETVLTFSVGDTQYVLTRRVGRTGATLEWGDGKITGIQAVNAMVSEFLGTSVDNLKEILFVPQESLDAPLKGTEAARKEAFGKLFGCHLFERLRAVIQAPITSLSHGESIEELDAQERGVEDLREAARVLLREATEAIEKLEKDIGPDSRAELVRILASTPQSKVADEIIRLSDHIAAVESQMGETTKTLDPDKDPNTLIKEKEYFHAVVRLLDTGQCPVCRLQGGDSGYTREGAEEQLASIEAHLQGIQRFAALDDDLQRSLQAVERLQAQETTPDAIHSDAREKMGRLDEMDQNLRELYGRRGSAEANIANADRLSGDILERREALKRTSAIIDTLSRVRDCFHRDAVQKDLRFHGVEMLNGWLRDMLAMFTIPYQVYFDDEGLLRFRNPGEDREHDFTELSGGQRKIVALAYRLALMRLFTGNLSVAVLDEPTPFIDKGNIEAMNESLQNLNRISLQKGLTVLVATHEEALFPAFSQIISMDDQQ